MNIRWISAVVVATLAATACGSPDPEFDAQRSPSPFADEIAARIAVDITVIGDGTVLQDPDEIRPGRPATLTAIPGLGDQFVGWSGDVDGAVNPIGIESDTDLAITATFEPIPPIGPNFTINIDGPGTVSRISGPVIEGTISLRAIPDSGARFDRWGGMVENSTNPVDLPMREDNEITAYFVDVVQEAPVINVWGGSRQRFDLGIPQRWINIRGNVNDPDGVASLGYSLDGGSVTPLKMGPDDRRLHDLGDFNIELDTETLPRGTSIVVIVATDTRGVESQQEVTVEFIDKVWPLPYQTNWGAAGAVEDQAQVVDGLWRVGADGITNHQIGYDRLVAIGDTSWTNYTARFTLRINGEDRSGYDETSEPFVGIVLRWPGHSFGELDESDQPRWGYWPSGSLSGYYLSLDGTSQVKLESNRGFLFDDQENFVLDFDVDYEVRATVEQGATAVQHRLKIWPAGTDEPIAWTVDVAPDLVDAGPEGGSLLLVAHYFDVTFGDVTVTPLE